MQMNILVIGNGFDLAHGLPTKYTDFLDFCKKISKIYTLPESIKIEEFVRDNIWDWNMDVSIKKKIADAFDDRIFEGKYDWEMRDVVTTSNKFIDEFYSHIKDSVWIEYFLKCFSYFGENWIDFELEMSRVIQILDEIRIMVNTGISVTKIQNEKKEILLTILGQGEEVLQNFFGNITKIDAYILFLNYELEKLMRALEIYIAEFVNEITITNKIVEIVNIHPDYVLSFNYSNTYERVYDIERKIEYSYIHGKADINGNIEKCNLVLGIDEYLSDDRKNSELNFLVFKKFYQRIYKQTGCEYKKWIDEIRYNYLSDSKLEDTFNEIMLRAWSEGKLDLTGEFMKFRHLIYDRKTEIHNLYFFGHSLDITDKDVLKEMILNDNVRTTIFYPDKKELGRKIANLVKVIGQDELIRRTGGSTKTIEFKQQQDMIPIEK